MTIYASESMLCTLVSVFVCLVHVHVKFILVDYTVIFRVDFEILFMSSNVFFFYFYLFDLLCYDPVLFM